VTGCWLVEWGLLPTGTGIRQNNEDIFVSAIIYHKDHKRNQIPYERIVKMCALYWNHTLPRFIRYSYICHSVNVQ